MGIGKVDKQGNRGMGDGKKWGDGKIRTCGDREKEIRNN